MTKKCTNCFQLKPLTEFYRKLKRHQARCKDCNAEVCRSDRERAIRKKLAERWAKMGTE